MSVGVTVTSMQGPIHLDGLPPRGRAIVSLVCPRCQKRVGQVVEGRDGPAVQIWAPHGHVGGGWGQAFEKAGRVPRLFMFSTWRMHDAGETTELRSTCGSCPPQERALLQFPVADLEQSVRRYRETGRPKRRVGAPVAGPER